jgi:outer membrane protein TolC
MMAMWRVLTSVLLWVLAACKPSAAPPQPPPPEVTVGTVGAEPVALDLTYAASTAGLREVEVRPCVSGILLERRYQEGARVVQGQSLFQIDPAPIRARVTAARAQVDVATARLAEARRQRDRVVPLFEQNAVSQSRRDEVISSFEVAQANLTAVRAELQAAQLDLEYSNVRARGPGATFLTPQTVMPEAVLLPPDLPAAILQRRADIRSAEAALMSAAADMGALRAQAFPRISLTGAFGAATLQLAELCDGHAETYTLGGNVTAPMYSGGALSGALQRASALRTQRRAEYFKTVQRAFREVLDGLNGQGVIAAVRDANAAQVAALQRAGELAELRYAQGDLGFLELLDVRRSLFAARIELVSAQRDALLNTVNLALALGGQLGTHAGTMSMK